MIMNSSLTLKNLKPIYYYMFRSKKKDQFETCKPGLDFSNAFDAVPEPADILPKNKRVV